MKLLHRGEESYEVDDRWSRDESLGPPRWRVQAKAGRTYVSIDFGFKKGGWSVYSDCKFVDVSELQARLLMAQPPEEVLRWHRERLEGRRAW